MRDGQSGRRASICWTRSAGGTRGSCPRIKSAERPSHHDMTLPRKRRPEAPWAPLRNLWVPEPSGQCNTSYESRSRWHERGVNAGAVNRGQKRGACACVDVGASRMADALGRRRNKDGLSSAGRCRSWREIAASEDTAARQQRRRGARSD